MISLFIYIIGLEFVSKCVCVKADLKDRGINIKKDEQHNCSLD